MLLAQSATSGASSGSVKAAASVSFIFLFVLILVVGLAVVLAWARKARNHSASGLPSCGSCGYAVRGVSTLKCPECGADLREVGISTGVGTASVLAGCLPPLLLTILMFLVAVLGYNLLAMIVPEHRQQSISFDLNPVSDEYAGVMFETNLTIIVPPGNTSYFSGLDITSSYGNPPTTQVEIGGAGTKIRLKNISIEVMPKGVSGGAVTYGPPFSVDVKSGIASWTDAQGNRRYSSGPVTDLDVLAFLGTTGANTGDADVVIEAQQLHSVVDGLLSGTNQFTLLNFTSGGYGSGGSGQLGPVWLTPAYILGWFVAWVIGLVVLARRGRKSQPQVAA